ncbi:MAG: hypothetical protein GSR77_03240 [Desulfurococcales archaeon]|nr:hypothetical protein [Desulfurococcales archaeon]
MPKIHVSRNILILVFIIGILVASFLVYMPSQTLNHSYTLRIVLSKDAVDADLAYIEAYLKYPGGYSIATGKMVKGQELVLEFRIHVNQTLMKKELDLYRSIGENAYASFTIIVYGYNDNGETCIKSYTYTTYDYYREVTGDPLKASELASENPLRLLYLGTIYIDADNLGECTYFKPDLETIAPRLQPSKTTLMDIGYIPKPGECPGPVGFRLMYPDLVNMSNNPPADWYERIGTNVAVLPSRDIILKKLWTEFVYNFSYGKVYDSEYCSLTGAIENAIDSIGIPPGIYSMDYFLNTMIESLKKKYPDISVDWKDLYDYGTVIQTIDYMPIVGISAFYNGNGAPPTWTQASITIVSSPGRDAVTFYSFLGHNVLGLYSYTVNTVWTMTVAVSPGDYPTGIEQGYIFAPGKVIYYYDGILVYYVADSIVLENSTYYVITPVFLYTPIYAIAYDYTGMKGIIFNPFEDYTDMAKKIDVLFKNLTNLYLPQSTEGVIKEAYVIYNNTIPGYYNKYYMIPTGEDGNTQDTPIIASYVYNSYISYLLGIGNNTLFDISTLAPQTLALAYASMNKSPYTLNLFIGNFYKTESILLVKNAVPLEYLDPTLFNESNSPTMMEYMLYVWDPQHGS